MMRKISKKHLYALVSFMLIISVWWILSETRFKRNGIIPSPIETIRIIIAEVGKDSFLRAVFRTLERSFVSFIVSFVIASILAVIAHFKSFAGGILDPFIALCRSIPTMSLVLILLLTVGSNVLPAVVGFLVIFPLCYENMRAAITETDRKLIIMAKVFDVPKWRQIKSIYIPSMLPFIFSSLIAGFGLNIKVVISAEIMGLPSMSIGYLILSSKQSFDFGTSFAWMVIAVIISLICENAIRIIGRICMPYKYRMDKNGAKL